jgi:hypothetical protein
MAVMADCTVREEVTKIQVLGKRMIAGLRRLNRKLGVCERCELAEDCEFKQTFNATVSSVLAEIADEWASYG